MAHKLLNNPGSFRFLLKAALVALLLPGNGTFQPPARAAENGPAPVRILVHPDAAVRAERIHLEAIAFISAPETERARIGAIDLGDAPRPGMKKSLSGSWVASKIRGQEWLDASAGVEVPRSVNVEREFQEVTTERLRALFTDYVTARMEGARFNIKRFKVRGRKKLPLGRIGLALKDPGRKKLLGRFNVQVAVTVDGKACGNVILSGWLNRFEPVVCAGRALPKHAVVTAEDLKLDVIDISRAPGGLVGTLDAAVGKRVRNSVRAGAYFRENMLETPPVIHKGDRVKLVARTGALTVRAMGKALADAGMGEQIRVENISSNKRLTGRVKDATTVLIRF